MTLYALGLFVFSTDTALFDGLRRREDWRHGQQSRFGARDAFQFIGPGQDSITIGGTLVPQVQGSFTSLDTLRDMAAEGEVYQLIRGDGRVEGGFVITGLDTDAGFLLIDGIPRKVDFTLELARVE